MNDLPIKEDITETNYWYREQRGDQLVIFLGV